MKTQLLILPLLALAVQGCVVSNERSDANVVADSGTNEPESRDEIWGIGKRAVQLNSSPASALKVTVGGSRADNLEAAFWFCDYVATTRGVEATPIAMCSAAYDELKTEKFGGDFGALLGWWQQNKPTEHRKVASERGDAPVQQ